MSNIPFENIIKFGQRTMLTRPLFSVSWILGRFCNYKCSYCWPYARSDSIDYKDLATYSKVIYEIKRQARKNKFKEFHWSFSGGEPTAYKDLLELLNQLNDEETAYQSIHMTTNLSPGDKWWARWSAVTSQNTRRSITASHHAEFADETEFGDKCLQLLNENVYLTINQVMVPGEFWKLHEKCQRFYERGINVTLKPQSNTTAEKLVDGYTDEMINAMRTGFPQLHGGEKVHQIALYDNDHTEYLFDQAERFNSFGFNKFMGWSCTSGYQSIIIRGNEIKRGYSCHEKPLGTLDNFKIFEEPKRCITATCLSSADSKIPKTK